MNARLNSLLRTSSRLAFVAILGLSPLALAAGQITGRVSGYVYDPTHAALAEVPLTISGPALLRPISRVSDATGRFDFEQLPPGEKYVIEVNVEGFTPIRQTGITVRLGNTTAVEVNLTMMTASGPVETYAIVEKANPVLNPDSAQTGTVVNAETASSTPQFHQVETIPQQVAGVGPGNTPSTRGGFSRWGKFYVDGMDTTDITDGSITAPMNFDAVENFEIITGGLDAQYNSLGMVENVVTKTGSNTFTHDVNLTWSPPAFNARTRVAPNQPDFVQEYVNNTSPAPQSSFFSPVANVGGPLVKDRLWFFISGQLNRSVRNTAIVTTYSPLENRPTTTNTELARAKLTWQASAKDRLSVGFNYDHNRIDNSVGSGAVTRSGEQRIDRGGYFVILNYDHNFTDQLLFQLQAGTTNKLVTYDPEVQGVAHLDTLPRVTQFSSSGVQPNGFVGNFLHEAKQRYQFDPTLSWHLGQHQLKGGIQASYQRDVQLTGVTGTQRYFDRGGICDPTNPATASFCFQRVDYYNNQGDAAPLTTRGSVLNLGAFVQDTWTIGKRLTLIPGFRFDVAKLYADQNRFISNLTGVGPRFSAVYDIQGNRTKIVTAHYGRSNDLGNVFIAQHANAALTQVQTTWNGTAFPDCTIGSSLGGCTTSGGPSGRVFGKSPVTPHVDEVAVGYHQQVGTDAAAGVDGTYRRYSNLWADEEVNRIYDPTGTKIIGYVNGRAQSILRAETPKSAYRQYEGLDLWTSGTVGRLDLYAAYTLSFTNGTVDDYFSGYLSNPRQTQYYEGFTSDDRRHTLKGTATYRSPLGLDIGFRLQYRTGNPLWENLINPADASQRLYRSPRGTGFALNATTLQPDLNDPSSWVALRNPDQFIIDIQARYNLGKAFGLEKERLELIGLIVNALNTTETQSITDQYASRNSRFGLTSFRQNPLQGELILRVRN